MRVPNHVAQCPLELWNNESLFSSTLARDRLCIYEQPYLLRNIAFGSSKEKVKELKKLNSLMHWWEKLFQLSDIIILPPVLSDPNTDSLVNGSLKIIEYLEKIYRRRGSLHQVNSSTLSFSSASAIFEKQKHMTEEYDMKDPEGRVGRLLSVDRDEGEAIAEVAQSLVSNNKLWNSVPLSIADNIEEDSLPGGEQVTNPSPMPMIEETLPPSREGEEETEVLNRVKGRGKGKKKKS